MNFAFILSMVLILAAVVSVFVRIPVVSHNAFWFVIAAYVVLASSTGSHG